MSFVPSLNPGAGLTLNEATQAIVDGIEKLWSNSPCTIGIGFLRLHERELALLLVHGGMVALTRSIVKNWDKISKVKGLGVDGWRFFLEAVRAFLVDLERLYFHFDYLLDCTIE